MMKFVLVLLSSAALMSACSTAKCRTQKDSQSKVGAEAAVVAGGSADSSSSSQDRVRVYKPDGSLQCGQGRAIPLNEMEKDLKGIKTYSSINKNDGMMRIQVCGSPTGNHNIYEIDRKDLAAALKAGFKEWTFE